MGKKRSQRWQEGLHTQDFLVALGVGLALAGAARARYPASPTQGTDRCSYGVPGTFAPTPDTTHPVSSGLPPENLWRLPETGALSTHV